VFDYPNALGLFLGPIVVIACVELYQRVTGGTERTMAVRMAEAPPTTPSTAVVRDVTGPAGFWFIVAILSFVAIILAQSEAAIVAVVATVFLASLANRQTRFGTAVAFLVAVILITLSPWRGFVVEKLTLQDYSGQVRLTQWSETLDLLQDHWLLGAGLSGYPTVFAPYHKATHIEIFQYPHNLILNIWVELGLLGMIAFVLLAYQVVVSLRAPAPCLPAGRKQSSGGLLPRFAPRNDTQMGVFLALLQMTIHGLVDVPFFKNDLAILTFVLLAIVFSYAPHTPPAKQI
jgi:putative inorganic carbon (HCO3(-)) transporter